MWKKLIVGFSIGTASLTLIIGLNPNRWSTLSALGFYPPKLCTTKTSTNYSYQDYKISKNFFAKGGKINQKIINRFKRDDECSLTFMLHLTLTQGELDSAKLLIENGAALDPRFIDPYRPNPLFYFVEDTNTVKALIDDGADVNAVNKLGHNPLFFSRSREVVQTLIDNGADFKSHNPLFYAQNAEVAQALIDNGVDVNAKNTYGRTPLFYALNAEVAQILIDNGADVNTVDNAGKTPIYEAIVQQKHRHCSRFCFGDESIADETILELVKVLIDNGAELNPQAKDRDKAFLTNAFVNNRGTPELIQLLIDNGADVNATNKDGKTALFYRGSVGYKGLQQLISNSADVNARNNDGKTALFFHKNPESIKLLLDSGANVNIRDINGRTPLMEALDSENLSWAQLLANRGANVNVKDNTGETPLSLAKNDRVRSFLIDNGAKINPKKNDN